MTLKMEADYGCTVWLFASYHVPVSVYRKVPRYSEMVKLYHLMSGDSPNFILPIEVYLLSANFNRPQKMVNFDQGSLCNKCPKPGPALIRNPIYRGFLKRFTSLYSYQSHPSIYPTLLKSRGK